MIKRWMCLLLALLMAMSVISLTSCFGGNGNETEQETKQETNTDETAGNGTDTESATEQPTEKPTETKKPENLVYHVVPDCAWADSTKEVCLMEFVMGDSINPITFADVDASKMKYIEFDLYIPDATNIKSISSNSQFEITSSGKCDFEESAFSSNTMVTTSNLQQGWNHIKKSLPKGECNYAKVNFIRWFWIQPNKTIPGCKIANLRFTNDVSVEPPKIEMSALNAFIPTTKYPTEDVVVALLDVTQEPYNLDNTGKTDVTELLNKALKHVAALGGGTVWMPAGEYLVSDTITIPAFVTLRGDWQNPDKGNEYGTVILANVKSQADNEKNALFMIGGSAGVNGLTVYYPDQDLTNVKEYPFTFYTPGNGENFMLASVYNCTVINGYQGFGATVQSGGHEMFTLDNVYGTFLKTAAELRNSSDVGTCKSMHFGPKYWANSKYNTKSLTEAQIGDYTKKNAVGLLIGDLEWTEFTDIEMSHFKYGIQITKGLRIDFAGSFHDTVVNNTTIALKVDAIDTRWGMTVVNSTLNADSVSVQNASGGIVKLVNVKHSAKVTGTVTEDQANSVLAFTPSYDYSYTKPTAKLYVLDADKTGITDVSAALQQLLNEAGKTGGVVYLPAGFYLLAKPITVPAGVELRGAAGGPNRDQIGRSAGTVILASYGDDPTSKPTDQALITLKAGAGVNGLRVAFFENGPMNGADVHSVYAIRGTGKGVYVVNCAILAAAYGVDFSDCDNHYIKKLATACYYNAIKVGGKNGVVEGNLQNGTVMLRTGGNLSGRCKDWIDNGTLFSGFFEPYTRTSLEYIIVENGENEVIYNSFSYGCHDFLTNNGMNNLIVFNIGCDNIGGVQTLQNGGSTTVMGALRYNGISYKLKGGSLNLYARLTINDKSEKTFEGTYTPGGEPTVTSVKPNIEWANQTKENATKTFTMGNSVTGFSFAPIDCTGMNYIQFDLYIPDTSKLSTITKNSEFEISSSGTCDHEEKNWNNNSFLNGQTLTNGWNHVKVLIGDWGECDQENVNWIRWYWVVPEGTIDGCKVANLTFTVE